MNIGVDVVGGRTPASFTELPVNPTTPIQLKNDLGIDATDISKFKPTEDPRPAIENNYAYTSKEEHEKFINGTSSQNLGSLTEENLAKSREKFDKLDDISKSVSHIDGVKFGVIDKKSNPETVEVTADNKPIPQEPIPTSKPEGSGIADPTRSANMETPSPPQAAEEARKQIEASFSEIMDQMEEISKKPEIGKFFKEVGNKPTDTDTPDNRVIVMNESKPNVGDKWRKLDCLAVTRQGFMKFTTDKEGLRNIKEGKLPPEAGLDLDVLSPHNPRLRVGHSEVLGSDLHSLEQIPEDNPLVEELTSKSITEAKRTKAIEKANFIAAQKKIVEAEKFKSFLTKLIGSNEPSSPPSVAS